MKTNIEHYQKQLIDYVVGLRDPRKAGAVGIRGYRLAD